MPCIVSMITKFPNSRSWVTTLEIDQSKYFNTFVISPCYNRMYKNWSTTYHNHLTLTVDQYEDRLLTAKSYILVVDDEDTIREVVRRYLEREGYVVREAADWHEAPEIIR